MSTKTKQLVFSAAAIALATVISVVIKLPSLPNGRLCHPVQYAGHYPDWLLVRSRHRASRRIRLWYLTVYHRPLRGTSRSGTSGLSAGIRCSGTFRASFPKRKTDCSSAILWVSSGRLACHEISGLIFYTTYVGDFTGNAAAIWASVVYNLSYIVPEAVLTVILLLLPPVKKAHGQGHQDLPPSKITHPFIPVIHKYLSGRNTEAFPLRASVKASAMPHCNR